MPNESRLIPNRRSYNQWVANETLEDFALRFTARRARRWSDARVANTALGIVAFLALEAIGGAITLQYGFTNSLWAILVVCGLIFLFGLPICYHAARAGLDIDLLTRGAGFGYIGSTVSSLIYASFTFIFFALEAAIMSVALELLLGIPIAWAYVISALVVIPLVTHGITRISRFQLWTQPVWIVLQVSALLVILTHHADAVSEWTGFVGTAAGADAEFDLLLFGAAAAVIFPLMAQNGEQVDFLRFLPKDQEHTPKWWLALILAGPGWTLVGVVKLLAGSFLAVMALNHGVAAALADDPAHMYRVAFGYLTHNPDLALLVAGVFVVISQLKINVTNAYAGSLAWSNFFSRVTHSHPGRIVWLFFNVAIALLLMELGLYQAFENILIPYSSLVLAWIGSLVADLVINRSLGLRPRRIEFKRGHLYDVNPVGVLSMTAASILGIAGQLGGFGPDFKALAPFISLFLPFVTAPLIAYLTRGRYYLARAVAPSDEQSEEECRLCGNTFDAEDMSHCPAYGIEICSLCCALDSACADHCRPHAHLQAQTFSLLGRLLPPRAIALLHSSVAHFLFILSITGGLIAGLFALVYFSNDYAAGEALNVREALTKTYFLLLTVTGVLVWLYVLAQTSRRKALEEARRRSEQLGREVSAHEKTAAQLQAAKEAAVTANQAKSRYLSGVSHELRTPLNTVLGYAQLLESDRGLPAKNQQAAAAIKRNGEHLADVIEGLLEISKIEARRLELHRGRVNLAGLLEQLVDVFATQARARSLSFNFVLDNSPPSHVQADEKRLRQILTNLLTNAVKFTKEGGVTFRVSYRNQVARFTVQDSGVGISAEDRERIFEPFERVRNADTQFVSGTGLGLAIARLLSNLMGGDLALESRPGVGSTFTFAVMLPALREPLADAAKRATIGGYEGPRKTILVVDDEPSHRSLMADFLTPLGFRVLEAHNAAFCRQVLGEFTAHLLLLDVDMPVTDGWTLAQQLRDEGVALPIVMISGNALENQGPALERQLHDAYLQKPVRLDALLEKIGHLLQLQWIDGQAVDPSPAEASAKPARDEPLPAAADLEQLVSMARIGYLSGVQEKLDSLAAVGDSGFLRQLKSRAEVCDLDGMLQIIKGANHLKPPVDRSGAKANH